MGIHKVPYSGLIADLLIVVVAITINRFSWWIGNRFVSVFAVIGVLQALTMYAVMLNFDFANPAINKLPNFIQAMLTLMVIFAFGGFLWFFIPAMATDVPGLWTIATINAFVAVFGALIGYGITLEKNDNETVSVINKLIMLFVPAIYLSLSEIIIYTSVHTASMGKGMAIPAIIMSYLPIRVLLVIKPPNSKIEWGTAAFAFFWFIYSLN
jgi:hypothetical protein